ncbi:MAG: cysteine hydrolase [Clostridia bacterium]|nr:cysteine hydrolase [Clostridia bacterium]
MKRILVVVDMQNDFVDGALGTPEAVSILPQVAERIRSFDGDAVYVTFDTHSEDYMDTLEGKRLPVVHCQEGTGGWALAPAVSEALKDKPYRSVIKKTFGTFDIVKDLKEQYPEEEIEMELLGLCTDICVVSNALILRAGFPNAVIRVDAACCAGVTPEKHEAALETMRSCQIDVISGQGENR